MKWLNEKARKLEQGAIRRMFDRAAGMQNVISMGIGEPDMPTPQVVCEAGKRAMELGLTHYTPNAGMECLRRAVAERSYLQAAHYDPMREIVITNGGMGGLSLLFLVILDPGDEVLIQDPQWLNYAAQISYCGGVPVRVPTGFSHRFEMQPEDVEARITKRTKAILLNSPNNPTGSMISQETLERIAEIAQKYDLLVISDEVYHTLSYGTAHQSMALLDGMKERTVVINSFSKSYAMTGWRIGYTAAPTQIADRMTKCQENISACANSVGQYAAAAALEHPEAAEEIRQVFAHRRQLLLDGLRENPMIRYVEPEGAFYLFADIRGSGMDSNSFCERLLEEQRLVCIPGSAFGDCGEGFVRMAYTCAEADLRQALQRLQTFCETHGK